MFKPINRNAAPPRPSLFKIAMVALGLVTLAPLIQAADYVVVVSKATHDDPAWNRVVKHLVEKHRAEISIYVTSVKESLEDLRSQHPRHACFVATSAEAGPRMVADVHRLTRELDDDPYTDVHWGILTGFDADNALLIAQESKPLVIKKVASGTELAMDRVQEGVWYCELKQNRMVRKEPGQEAKEQRGPSDTTQALADTLVDYQADLFVTSGHATERDWQIGFSYPNGYFRCRNGELFGVDTKGQKIPIRSPNPKVYLPIGNCLMGNIDGPEAMALAFMNSAGVRQMIGYTVPTWYGYGGWGCLDYFVEQPGRYTFVEAFFANQHALVNRLTTNFPELVTLAPAPGTMPRVNVRVSETAVANGLKPMDGLGLLHDRDVVALYGDPAWDARMERGKLAFEQTLVEKEPGLFVFEIKPLQGEASFEPVNLNGSQRGFRPFVAFLPKRIEDVVILKGTEWSPIITDDFVMMPHPGKCDPGQSYRIEFKATVIEP